MTKIVNMEAWNALAREITGVHFSLPRKTATLDWSEYEPDSLDMPMEDPVWLDDEVTEEVTQKIDIPAECRTLELPTQLYLALATFQQLPKYRTASVHDIAVHFLLGAVGFVSPLDEDA